MKFLTRLKFSIALLLFYSFLNSGIVFAQTEKIRIVIPNSEVSALKVIPGASIFHWKADINSTAMNGALKLKAGDFKFYMNDLLNGTFEFDISPLLLTAVRDYVSKNKPNQSPESDESLVKKELPPANFRIKSFLPLTENVGNERIYRVTGELTICDKIREVSGKVIIKFDGSTAHINGTLPVGKLKLTTKYLANSFSNKETEKMQIKDISFDFNITATKI